MAKAAIASGAVFPPSTPYLSAATTVSQTIESGVKISQDTGLDEREAIYNLKFDVISSDTYRPSNRINLDQCGAEVQFLNEDDSPSNQNTIDDGNAPYYVSLKELINDFGTNNENGVDILELNVYSDYTN